MIQLEAFAAIQMARLKVKVIMLLRDIYFYLSILNIIFYLNPFQNNEVKANSFQEGYFCKSEYQTFLPILGGISK